MYILLDHIIYAFMVLITVSFTLAFGLCFINWRVWKNEQLLLEIQDHLGISTHKFIESLDEDSLVKKWNDSIKKYTPSVEECDRVNQEILKNW